jgi:nucleotide-binding universal stress UspA family protein
MLAGKTIVVATDLSPQGDIALHQAIALAQRYDTRLIVVHSVSDAETKSDISRSSIEVLQECQQAHARVELFLRAGPAVDNIVEVAENENADLLVVSSGSSDKHSGRGFGSVAEGLFRQSPCPVLIARASEHPGEFNKILVPVDFSPRGPRAVRAAMSLSDPGAVVELLHCKPEGSLTDAVLGSRHVERSEFFDMGASHGDESGDRALSLHARSQTMIEGLDLAGRQLHSMELVADPVRGIEDRLELSDFDLVVLCSHGRRGLKRWVLGSVSESIAQRAPCSVLVLREEMPRAGAMLGPESRELLDYS